MKSRNVSPLNPFDNYKTFLRYRLRDILASSRVARSQMRALRGLLANYSPEALRKRSSALAADGVAPEGYVLGITDQCNLSCNYCYSASGPNKGHDMDLNLACTLIAEMYEAFGITFVTISGGEPFPMVFSLAAKCPFTTFYVYTNGTRIDREAVAEIEKLGTIIPSLTIIGPESIHDGIRGAGSYTKVIKAVQELRRKSLIWGFSVTESKANLRCILDGSLFEMLSQYNPFFIRMLPFVPVGRKDKELCLPSTSHESIAKAIIDAKVKYGIIIHDYIHDDSLGIGCMAGGRRFFYVDPQFRMSPCVFMNKFEQIMYDSEKKRTNAVKILLNSELMSRSRTLASQYRCIVRDKPGWQSDFVRIKRPAQCG